MSRRRKHHGGHDEEHENHERWLISYADMITLLMVFFIVLFSMSTLDASKYRALVESFAEATGGGPKDVPLTAKELENTQPKPNPSASDPSITQPEDVKNKEDIAAELQKQIEQAGLMKDVKVISDERGVVLLLTNSLLFVEGDANILPAGRAVLGRLTPLIDAQNKPLVVEGHTDSQPINTSRYPTNWELSTSRATNVLRFLIAKGIESNRLTASGYADTHPRSSNASASGQAENRRVEIIVVVSPDSTRPAVAARS